MSRGPRLAAIMPLPLLGAPRSSKWATVRDKYLKGKKCACCGRKTNLNAHHIKPFHLFPELELSLSNLIPLCEGGPLNCHFYVGHAGASWSKYHPDPWAAIESMKGFLKSLKAQSLVA